MTKCPKCGYENPPEAKYCLNCGFKLFKEESERLEGAGILLLTSGIIMLVTFLFNALVRVLPILELLYMIFGITSVYSGYRLYKGTKSLADLVTATLSIIFGLAATLFLYLYGLAFKGLVTPDWIIFLVAGIKLFSDRKKLLSSFSRASA